MRKLQVMLIASIASLFLTNGVAIDIDTLPSIQKRVMPDVSNSTVFSFHEAIKDAKDAVVNISTQKRIRFNQHQNPFLPFMQDPMFRQFFGDMFDQIIPRDRVERSLGSGVIISKDGYIVTNNHVINNADEVIVTLPNDKNEYKAKIIGKDPRTDLAVIKIDAKNLKYVKFADSNDLKEGDIVFAIGNPFGVGETVTQGIVSALNKSGIGINDYENFIQTDAAINPGNSGGALIDTRGALVGINTAIISQSGGNVGIGFAIPSNMVKKIVTQLVDKGEVERGYLGVSIQDVNEKLKDFYGIQDGALILAIEPDSPAHKAGLKKGDLIIEVNDKKINNSADLKNEIGSFSPGDKISITYLRDKKRYTTTVELTKFLDERSSINRGLGSEAFEGLEVSELSNELRSRYKIPKSVIGVIITGVKEGSNAFEAGFNEGDVITQVEQNQITNIKDLKEAIRKYGNTKKRVYINRRGLDMVLVLR